jgi:hypothetical protein
MTTRAKLVFIQTELPDLSALHEHLEQFRERFGK